MRHIGLRKGKRRAIHTFGIVKNVKGQGPYEITVDKSIVGGALLRLKTEEELPRGMLWIAIAPAKEGIATSQTLVLKEIKKINDKHIRVFFEANKGTIRWIDMVLDDRGRAENLEKGRAYSISIMSPGAFFQEYERKSLPVGRSGRSESFEVGRWRIEIFKELSSTKNYGQILDCATGLKDYLKNLVEGGRMVVCMNYSTTILKRTRDWLGSQGVYYVRYDADKGFPFNRKSFDLVLLDALLEYTESPLEVLRKSAEILKKGGDLLLLEPTESEDLPDFYPQDLWEAAFWRAKYDRDFSRNFFQEQLKKEGLDRYEQRVINFEYPIYTPHSFSQTVGAYTKL